MLALVAALGIWGGLGVPVGRMAREGVYPYQVAWLWLAHTAGHPFRVLAELGHGESERRRLAEEVNRLRLLEARLAAVESENDELRRLLEMSRRTPARSVVGRVISRGGAGDWWSSLRIAAGSSDGVAVNQPALGPGGLVGRVVFVSANTSEILLITDPNSRLAARLAPPLNQVRGVIFGSGALDRSDTGLKWLYSIDPLRWRYIKRDVEIPDDHLVETSGLGGVFPAGLPVGRVVRSRIDPKGLYREAEVLPLVDPGELNHVMILVWGVGQ